MKVSQWQWPSVLCWSQEFWDILVPPPQGLFQFLILLVSPTFSAAHGYYLSNRIHSALLEKCYSFPRQEISSLSKHFSEPKRATVEKSWSKTGARLAGWLKKRHSAVCITPGGKTCSQCEGKKISTGLSVPWGACKEPGSNGSLRSSHSGLQTSHCKSGLAGWQSSLHGPQRSKCAAPFCQCSESVWAISRRNCHGFKPWESRSKGSIPTPKGLRRDLFVRGTDGPTEPTGVKEQWMGKSF